MFIKISGFTNKFERYSDVFVCDDYADILDTVKLVEQDGLYVENIKDTETGKVYLMDRDLVAFGWTCGTVNPNALYVSVPDQFNMMYHAERVL